MRRLLISANSGEPLERVSVARAYQALVALAAPILHKVLSANWKAATGAAWNADPVANGMQLVAKHVATLKQFCNAETLEILRGGDVTALTLPTFAKVLLRLKGFLKAGPTAGAVGRRASGGDASKQLAQIQAGIEGVAACHDALVARYNQAKTNPRAAQGVWEAVAAALGKLGVPDSAVVAARAKAEPGAGAGAGAGAGSRASGGAVRRQVNPRPPQQLRVTKLAEGKLDAASKWEVSKVEDRGATFDAKSAMCVTVGTGSSSVSFGSPTAAVDKVFKTRHCAVRWLVAEGCYVLDNMCLDMVSTFVHVTRPVVLQPYSWVLVGDVLRPNNRASMATAALRLVPQGDGSFAALPPGGQAKALSPIVDGSVIGLSAANKAVVVNGATPSGVVPMCKLAIANGVVTVHKLTEHVHIVLSPNEQFPLPVGTTTVKMGHMQPAWAVKIDIRAGQAPVAARAATPKAPAAATAAPAPAPATATAAASPPAKSPSTPPAAQPKAAQPVAATKAIVAPAAAAAGNDAGAAAGSSPATSSPKTGAWGLAAPVSTAPAPKAAPRRSRVGSASSGGANSSQSGAGKGGNTRPRRRAPAKRKRIMVPTKCRGAIIGISGATVKGLESKHNTKITLQDQSELSARPKESFVDIAGKVQEEVDACAADIMEVVATEEKAQRAKFAQERRASGRDGERTDRRRRTGSNADSDRRPRRGDRNGDGERRERRDRRIGNGGRRSDNRSSASSPAAAPAPAPAAAPLPPAPDMASQADFPSLG